MSLHGAAVEMVASWGATPAERWLHCGAADAGAGVVWPLHLCSHRGRLRLQGGLSHRGVHLLCALRSQVLRRCSRLLS